MEETESIVRILKEYFSHHDEIGCVLLFGSYAKKTANSMSDVDVGIMYTNKKDSENFDRWLEIKKDLNILLKKEIDLIVLNNTEGLLLAQILKNNIKIKDLSSIYAELVLKNVYFHEDFMPIVKANQNYKIKKVLHG